MIPSPETLSLSETEGTRLSFTDGSRTYPVWNFARSGCSSRRPHRLFLADGTGGNFLLAGLMRRDHCVVFGCAEANARVCQVLESRHLKVTEYEQRGVLTV